MPLNGTLSPQFCPEVLMAKIRRHIDTAEQGQNLLLLSLFHILRKRTVNGVPFRLEPSRAFRFEKKPFIDSKVRTHAHTIPHTLRVSNSDRLDNEQPFHRTSLLVVFRRLNRRSDTEQIQHLLGGTPRRPPPNVRICFRHSDPLRQDRYNKRLKWLPILTG